MMAVVPHESNKGLPIRGVVEDCNREAGRSALSGNWAALRPGIQKRHNVPGGGKETHWFGVVADMKEPKEEE